MLFDDGFKQNNQTVTWFKPLDENDEGDVVDKMSRTSNDDDQQFDRLKDNLTVAGGERQSFLVDIDKYRNTKQI